MSPERFLREIKKLAPEAGEETLQKLLLFGRLLRETAHPLGLIGETRETDLLEKHLMDSAFLRPHLRQGPVADLGSGAGLPGLVLAILSPELEIWLVEPRRKAISFLEYARVSLGLERVRIVRARAEAPEVPRGYFETVTARALADLESLWRLAEPLLRPGGFLLAPKGPRGRTEVENLKNHHPDLVVETFPYRLSGGGLRMVVRVLKGSPS